MSPSLGVLYVAEPPNHYLVLPPLVVDCSTLAGLLFQEDSQNVAAQRIFGKALHAPYLLQVELTSVAAKKHKLGRTDIAQDGLAQFRNLHIDLHQIEPEATLALAVRYKLAAYDAAYLWLAAELKAPLATFDEQLGRAAQVHLATLT